MTCIHEALVELDDRQCDLLAVGPLSRLLDMVKRSMRLIYVARAKLQEDGVADLVEIELEDCRMDLIKETS